MFVSRSLKSRFSFEKTQSVPRSVVGVETGTHTAAGKSSGTFQVAIRLSSLEDHGVAQQRFEIGHGPLQRSGGGGKPIEGQSPRATQFQFGGGLIEEIERRGVAADGLRARPQDRLQSFGQVFLFLAVRNHRHSGRQLGLAPAERVPRLEQLAEQIGDGAGQCFGGGARDEGSGGARAEGGRRRADRRFRISDLGFPVAEDSEP